MRILGNWGIKLSGSEDGLGMDGGKKKKNEFFNRSGRNRRLTNVGVTLSGIYAFQGRLAGTTGGTGFTYFPNNVTLPMMLTK